MSQSGDNSPLLSFEDQVADLIRRIRQGEDEAFALLAIAYTPTIRYLVSSLRVPREERADLMQEGLLGLYQAAIRFDPALASFSTFASLCIRSAVTDALRKYLRRVPFLPLPDSKAEEVGSERSPEGILMEKEALREWFTEAESLLSPLEKRVFRLASMGFTTDEMAKRLEKDAKSIGNALYRIRKKLADRSF